MGHNYIGHNYIGHNYMGHNYIAERGFGAYDGSLGVMASWKMLGGILMEYFLIIFFIFYFYFFILFIFRREGFDRRLVLALLK